MPLYEFECLECGTIFEKLVRKAGAISDVACPVCHSLRVTQQISTCASFVRGKSSGPSRACPPSGG